MSIDIKKFVIDYVARNGIDHTSKLTGKGVSAVSSWGITKNPSLDDIQLMLNKDDVKAAEKQEALSPAISPYTFPEGKRVMILMPSVRPIHIGVLKSFAALYEKDKMQFYTNPPDNSYVRARNNCAARFLESGCEYAFWLDDDTIVPHGDVEYFRRISNNPQFPANYIMINPIARLMQTGKTLIGGCYFGRNPRGVAQFQEAYQSVSTNFTAHTGPRDVVTQAGWIGFGCTLVHRKVFEDIIKTQPEVAVKNAAFAKSFNYNWGFFNFIDEEHSEDASFCHRAMIAGHSTFVDFAVMPVHMGEMGYSYLNTATAMKPLFQPKF